MKQRNRTQQRAVARGWWQRHETAFGYVVAFASLAFLGAIVAGWMRP